MTHLTHASQPTPAPCAPVKPAGSALVPVMQEQRLSCAAVTGMLRDLQELTAITAARAAQLRALCEENQRAREAERLGT